MLLISFFFRFGPGLRSSKYGAQNPFYFRVYNKGSPANPKLFCPSGGGQGRTARRPRRATRAKGSQAAPVLDVTGRPVRVKWELAQPDLAWPGLAWPDRAAWSGLPDLVIAANSSKTAPNIAQGAANVWQNSTNIAASSGKITLNSAHIRANHAK